MKRGRKKDRYGGSEERERPEGFERAVFLKGNVKSSSAKIMIHWGIFSIQSSSKVPFVSHLATRFF